MSFDSLHFKIVGPSPPPRNYCKEMDSLLKVFGQEGFVKVPKKRRASCTSRKDTKQCWSKWPPIKSCHIAWLAELISCTSLNEVDRNGWNILHHLFHIVTCSELAAWICHTMNRPYIPNLAGDLRRALTQLTTGTTPNQWAPCHFLCQDSDSNNEKSLLIYSMLRRKVLLPTDFDIRNDKVFFFKPITPCPSYVRIRYTHRMTRLQATHLRRNELRM